MTFASFLGYIDKVNKKLVDVPKDKQDQLSKTLELSFTEQTRFFEINSQSFANQTIDLETSQYVYNSLKDWSSTSLAAKMAITQLMSELLKIRIAAH